MAQSFLSSRQQRGRVILALFAVSTLFASLCVAPVQAASGGLSIGPFLQEVTLAPGQAESSFRITVTNTTSAELPLRLSVVDFGAADESGGINFLPSADNLERRYGLASWMRLEKDALVLAPGKSQQVTVTVDNRESLSPGGHYGAVVFEVDKERNGGEIQPKVDFTKAVSTLVLAKKLGGEKRSITLSNSAWSGPPFFLPREVKLRFLNNGNVHTTPTGDVTLTDMFNRTISKGAINPESTVVLPESMRSYPVKLTGQSTLWLPGWVTVTTRYKVGDAGKYVTTKTSFFIATPRSMVVVLLLAFVSFILLRYHRHGIRHARRLGTKGHAVTKKIVTKTARKVAAQRAKRRKSRQFTKHK